MAKRKKLNTRVILLIAVFTVILIACIGIYLWQLPSDPAVYVQQAQAALKESPRNYDKAIKAYGKAIKISEDMEQAECQYDLAELYFERANEVGLSPSDRRDYIGSGFGNLRMILQHHPSFIPAHRLYEKKLWEYIGLAGDLTQTKDYIESVDKILKLEDDAGLYFRRGQAKMRLAMNDPATFKDPAIEDLRKAIELQPAETQYWKAYSKFFSYLKQEDEAEKVLQEGIKANPKNAAFLIEYASYLVEKKREDEAIQILKDAIALEPQNPQGYISLASLYLQKKQLTEAMEAWAQAQKIDDTQPQLYFVLSGIRKAEKDYEGAAQALRDGLKMLEKTSGDNGKRIDPVAARRMVNFWLAGTLLDIYDRSDDQAVKDKALAEARQCYDTLEKLAPNTVYQYQIGGKLAFIDKDWNKARQYLEQSAAGGMDINTMLKLIQVYINLQMPGSAETMVANVLKMQNLNEEARAIFLIQLSLFLTERRDYTSARDYAEKVLRIQPDNERAKEILQVLDVAEGKTTEMPAESAMGRQMVFRRAQELLLQENYDSAINLLEKLYSDDPKDFRTLAILVMAMERAERQEEAIQLVRDALQKSPDQRALQQWLRLLEEPDPDKRLQIEMEFADQETDPLRKALSKRNVARRYGRSDESLKYLKEAEAIDPENMAVIGGLLQLAMQNKNWEEAKALAKRVEKISPNSGEAELLQAQILINEQEDKKGDAASRDYTEPVAILEKLVSAKPYLGSARLLLANCYLKDNRPDDARKQLETCLAQNKQDIQAIIGLAKLAESQKKLEEHQKWIRVAYHYPAGQADRYVREKYIQQEIEAKDVKAAIQEREKNYENNKRDFNNAYRLGQLYEKTKQVSKAQDIYEYLFKSISDKVGFAPVLADFYKRNDMSSKADALYGAMLKEASDPKAKAAVYISYGNFLREFDLASAKAMYNKAIESDKDSIQGLKALADLAAFEAQSLAQQGNIPQSQAKWKESIDILKKIADNNPSDLSAQKTLFRQYINAGMIPEAILGFQRLVEQHPDDADLLVGLGLAKMKNNDLVAAENLFKQAIKLQPDSVEPHILLAKIYQANGDMFAAVEEIKLATQLTEDLAIRMDLARMYQSMGKLDDAVRIYNEILGIDKTYFPAYKNLINIFGNQEKWDALESLANSAKDKFPESPEIYLDLAKMWQKRGDPGRRIQALESALKISSEDAVVIQYLYALSQARQDDKLASEATKYIDNPALKASITALLAQSLANRQPNSEQAFNQFLEALGQLQKPDDAFFVMALMQEAYGLEKLTDRSADIIKTLPREWRVLIVLGDASSQLGKFAQAEKFYNDALPLCSADNEKTLVLQKLAFLFSKANEPEKTVGIYKRIIELNPNSVSALNNLAYLYVDDMDKPQEALPYIQKAMQMQPGNINLIDTYAWTLAKLGKLQEARTELNLLINKKVSGPEILYHIGYVLEKTNDAQGARNYYRQALEAIGDQQEHPLRATIQSALDRVNNALNEKE